MASDAISPVLRKPIQIDTQRPRTLAEGVRKQSGILVNHIVSLFPDGVRSDKVIGTHVKAVGNPIHRDFHLRASISHLRHPVTAHRSFEFGDKPENVVDLRFVSATREFRLADASPACFLERVQAGIHMTNRVRKRELRGVELAACIGKSVVGRALIHLGEKVVCQLHKTFSIPRDSERNIWIRIRPPSIARIDQLNSRQCGKCFKIDTSIAPGDAVSDRNDHEISSR